MTDVLQLTFLLKVASSQQHEITDHAQHTIYSRSCSFLGVIGKAPAAVNDSLPTGELEGATGGPSASHDDEEDEEEMDEMKARLEALRS